MASVSNGTSRHGATKVMPTRTGPTENGSPRGSPIGTSRKPSGQKNGLPPGVTTAGVSSALVKCPVCRKPYRSPKLLRCLHSFCEPCLQTCLASSDLQPGQPFCCPLCRTECVLPRRGTATLPDNVLLETLGQLSAKKAVPTRPRCEGCEEKGPAQAKCVECDDWLCATCCDMHRKVKVSRGHHLVSPDVLDAGEADGLIKANFHPLVCGKHGEPLKLYCAAPTCGFPICTVCKSTLGHDGHPAQELDERARQDREALQALLPGVLRHTDALHLKVQNIKTEDRLTATVRKQLHQDINVRMEQVVEAVVQGIGKYAESLHTEVERLAKGHKEELVQELETCQFQLAATTCAQTLAGGLLNDGRMEEVVRLTPVVSARLDALKTVPDVNPPGWHRPRLHPALLPSTSQIAQIFGELTFEGHVIRCQELRSFSTKLETDSRNCSVSDVSISADNDIVIADKDNRKVKVFSSAGEILFSTESPVLKMPTRAAVLKGSGNVIIKDDKVLRVMATDGTMDVNFAGKVRHPIAVTENRHGEVLVSDWNTGNVHCFTPEDKQVYQFPTNLEAPAYIACSRRDHIIVSDWKQNVVRVYERGGGFLWQYGKEEGQSLDHPYGVCSDRYGHVLVADSWNHRIHLVSEEGHFLRFLLDKDSGIQYPQALAVTLDGMLVVAEVTGTVKLFQYLA